MKQNETAAVTAKTAKPTNDFDREIVRLKAERDSIVKDYKEAIRTIENANHELKEKIRFNQTQLQGIQRRIEEVYRDYREAICEIKYESLDNYSTHDTTINRVGKMLSLFFDAHPEIKEIWDAEKENYWNQTQKGGAE